MRQHSIFSRKGENESLAQRTCLQRCPVTQGQQTRMKMSSFKRVCEQRQQLASGKNKSAFATDLASKFCNTCKGAIVPPELIVLPE